MKRIIVPVDFSEHSNYAMEEAAQLAHIYDYEIIALHMLEMSDAIISISNSTHQANAVFFLKLAEKKFEEFLNKPYLKDVLVTPIVKHFKVFNEINDIAKEFKADLIVMGSHGASGLKELLIGSNTEKVVRHSDIPVLVIKQKPTSFEFKTVVFASNFSLENINPYLKACQFFEALKSKISLVYVNVPTHKFKSSNEMEEHVRTFLQRADGNQDKMKDVHFISDYTVESGVLNFSNKIGANVIAIPTHGRTGIAHFFEGSITENIANHSVRPVMTFKI